MARNVSRCSKRWCCVRESSTSTDGLRADGFIAFADKDPSKDLPFDVFGSDPSNISFSRASSNILFEKTFEAGYKKDATYKGLVNGNTKTRRTIAARSLSSIRKYYTNLWSVICLSMSATALTKARSISSKPYNAYDAQCNYMQHAL
jgi:hypothetical protein